MSKKKIFLIDDDQTTNYLHLTLISTTFKDYTITEFEAAYEFLEFLVENIDHPQNLPDYILLDINMPQMNGWEFLDEYKKTIYSFMRSCKIVMVTSSNNSIDLERVRLYPFVKGYYVKPLTTKMLYEIFDEIQEP